MPQIELYIDIANLTKGKRNMISIHRFVGIQGNFISTVAQATTLPAKFDVYDLQASKLTINLNFYIGNIES